MQISSYSLMFQGILWIGLFESNPLGVVFNSTWLIPMLLSPFVLMMYNGYGRKAGTAPSEIDRAHVSALKADPALVHELLSTVVSTEEAGLKPLVG